MRCIGSKHHRACEEVLGVEQSSEFLTNFLYHGMKESEGPIQPAAMTTYESGDTLDHYRIEAAVAHSGMSVLYRATDLHSGGQVAIKVPLAEMEADPVLLERFKREQEIGQSLDHPGVVKTFNDEERSQLYMVIEWVEGRLLRTHFERREETAH